MMDSTVYQVFNTWELVNNIFVHLPWHQVFHMRNMTQETLNYCKRNTLEIEFDNAFKLTDEDYFDLFKLIGPSGCENLTKLDLRKSTTLSKKIGPILKYCEKLKTFGFTKSCKGHKFYFNMLYCTNIEEFAVVSSIPKFFTDSDVIELHMILPKLRRLEMPSTNVTNAALLEISDEQVNLEYLDLSSCHGISDFGLTHVFEKCQNLVGINVTDTPTMHHCVDDIISFSEKLTYLKANHTFISYEGSLTLKAYFESKKLPTQFLHDSYLLEEAELSIMLAQRVENQFNDTMTTSSTSSEDPDFDSLDDDDDDDFIPRMERLQHEYNAAIEATTSGVINETRREFNQMMEQRRNTEELSEISSMSDSDDSDIDFDNLSEEENLREIPPRAADFDMLSEEEKFEDLVRRYGSDTEIDMGGLTDEEMYQDILRRFNAMESQSAMESPLVEERSSSVDTSNSSLSNFIREQNILHNHSAEDLTALDERVDLNTNSLNSPVSSCSPVSMTSSDASFNEKYDYIWKAIDHADSNLKFIERKFDQLVEMIRKN